MCMCVSDVYPNRHCVHKLYLGLESTPIRIRKNTLGIVNGVRQSGKRVRN